MNGCCDIQGGDQKVAELVGMSQAYLLKLVQSCHQHFLQSSRLCDLLALGVSQVAVVMHREVTRKWLSWWV